MRKIRRAGLDPRTSIGNVAMDQDRSGGLTPALEYLIIKRRIKN
jgi:hypothetical protein